MTGDEILEGLSRAFGDVLRRRDEAVVLAGENRALRAELEDLKQVHEALRASVGAAPRAGDGRYRIVLEPREGEWRARVEGVRPTRLCFATGTPAYVAGVMRQEMEAYDRDCDEEERAAHAEDVGTSRPVEPEPEGDDGIDLRASFTLIHARIEGLIRRLEKLEMRMNHRDRAYDRLHEAVAKSNHRGAGLPA